MATIDDFWSAHDALMVAISLGENSKRTAESTYCELKKVGATASQIEGLRAEQERLRALAADPEACANIMVSFARETCDRIAWMFIFARFDDFVTAGKVPPFAFIELFNAAFNNFRSAGCKSLDDAFFGKRGRGQPKLSCTDYLYAKTNASLVVKFLACQNRNTTKRRGDIAPLDAAIQATIEFRKSGNGGKVPRGCSAAHILRQYLNFKK